MTFDTTTAKQDGAAMAGRISEALDCLAAENPVHASFIKALKGLMVARSELAESLELPDFKDSLLKDRALFLQGSPLIPKGKLPMDTALLKACAAKLTPVLAETFPAQAEALRALGAAFASGKMRLKARVKALAASGALPDKPALRAAGSTPEAAGLLLGQIVKTIAEGVAARVRASADLSGWTKGYCPVCGSPPEISYLEGQEGKRMLSCSLCATTWRFTRVACPSCETDKHDQIEIFYAEDKPKERAEACNACKRYVLSVDRRERARELVPSVEPLALMHLDIIMQERGYTPASGESAVTG